MGWASRSNPTASTEAQYVRAEIRAFLRRHPAQLKPLLKELGKPWGEVQAWMRAIDAAVEDSTDPAVILPPDVETEARDDGEKGHP